MAGDAESNSLRICAIFLLFLSPPVMPSSSSSSTSSPDIAVTQASRTPADTNSKTPPPHRENLTQIFSTFIDQYTDLDLYLLLVQVARKLDILPSSSTCIKLEKISRDVIIVNKRTHSQTVGVHLYFHTRTKDDVLSQSHDCSPVPVINVAGLARTRDELPLRDSTSGAGHGAVTTVKVKTVSEVTSQVNNGSAGVLVGTQSGQKNRQTDGDKEGISRTQLVVISTCSAIIGTFFIVAGLLRLRYYYKRYQEEQTLSQRPTFRSCSIALRNPMPSTEHIRRDSMLSKSSSYQSNCTHPKSSNQSQNGMFSRDQSGNSSPKMAADKTPLLVVTNASDPSSPMSSLSQQSFQFMDEEPAKKKNSPYTTNQDDTEAEPLLTQEFERREITPNSRQTFGAAPVTGRTEEIENCNSLYDQDQPNNIDKARNRNQDVLISADGEQKVEGYPLATSPQFSSGSNSGDKSLGNSREITPGSSGVMPQELPSHHPEESPPGFGLTQSDSSLDATNPFHHSHQAEYCPPAVAQFLEHNIIPMSHGNSQKQPLLRSVSLPMRSFVDQNDHNRFQNTSLRTTGPSYSLYEHPSTAGSQGASPVVSQSSLDSAGSTAGQYRSQPGQPFGQSSLDSTRSVVGQSSLDSTRSVVGQSSVDSKVIGQSRPPAGPGNVPIVGQSSVDSKGPVIGQSRPQAGPGNVPVVGQSSVDSKGPVMGQSRPPAGPGNVPVVGQSSVDSKGPVIGQSRPPACPGNVPVVGQSSVDSKVPGIGQSRPPAGPGNVPVVGQSSVDSKGPVIGQSRPPAGPGNVPVVGQSSVDSKGPVIGQSRPPAGPGNVPVVGQSSVDYKGPVIGHSRPKGGPGNVPVVGQSSLDSTKPIVGQSSLDSTKPIVGQSSLDSSKLSSMPGTGKSSSQSNPGSKSNLDSTELGNMPTIPRPSLDSSCLREIKKADIPPPVSPGNASVSGHSLADPSGLGKTSVTGLDSNSVDGARNRNKTPLTRESNATVTADFNKESSRVDGDRETGDASAPPGHSDTLVRQSNIDMTSASAVRGDNSSNENESESWLYGGNGEKTGNNQKEEVCDKENEGGSLCDNKKGDNSSKLMQCKPEGDNPFKEGTNNLDGGKLTESVLDRDENTTAKQVFDKNTLDTLLSSEQRATLL